MQETRYLAPEPGETPTVKKVREKFDAQLAALDDAHGQYLAKRQQLDQQLADGSFPTDIEQVARQMRRELIELRTIEISLRRTMAAEWYPVRNRHRAAYVNQAEVACEVMRREIAEKLASIGFDPEGQAEQLAGFHPRVAELATKAFAAASRRSDRSDEQENDTRANRLAGELSKLARQAVGSRSS